MRLNILLIRLLHYLKSKPDAHQPIVPKMTQQLDIITNK